MVNSKKNYCIHTLTYIFASKFAMVKKKARRLIMGTQITTKRHKSAEWRQRRRCHMTYISMYMRIKLIYKNNKNNNHTNALHARLCCYCSCCHLKILKSTKSTIVRNYCSAQQILTPHTHICT